MQRPDWVPGPAWRRLEVALRAHPEHAQDALEDLDGLVATWDDATRERFLARFVERAEDGLSLPAAFILGVSDLLERDDG